jgi:hypothetical protein
MGTRNLTMVFHEKKMKLAQYGQWDGYPDGNGVKVLNFLKTVDLDVFKKKLNNIRFATEKDEKEIEEYLETIGCKDGWMNSEQAELYHQMYSYLSRDIGANILNLIYRSHDEVMVHDQTEFAADSLFCEWAYLINLDKNTLEVYQGFNKKPLGKTQRFKYLEKPEEQYKPIRCVKTFKLDSLPTVEEFVMSFHEIA